jgi:hypothetical protein
MKKHTEMYLVALLVFICSTVFTVAIVLLYAHNKVHIISIPFFMLSLVPIIGYSISIYLLFAGHEIQVIEKRYSRGYKYW